ncbi:MAG: hypothetical protein AAF529_07265 [Pseudomonadota bacterium]
MSDKEFDLAAAEQKLPLENLRQAFASRPGDVDGSACPPAEAIFEAAAGHGEQAERLAIIDQIANCQHCGELWQLAVELHRDDDGKEIAPVMSTDAGAGQQAHNTDNVVPLGKRAGRERAYRPLLAAAATLVLAAGVTLLSVEDQPSPTYRGADQTYLIPELTSTDQKLRFEWKSGFSNSEVMMYRLQILDADLQLLFETEVAATEVATGVIVVDRTQLSVQDGELVYWLMEATLADGRTVESASTQSRIN